MKKSLKTLKLNKEVISSLELGTVNGGGCPPGGGGAPAGPTNGALWSCPPPGVQCM